MPYTLTNLAQFEVSSFRHPTSSSGVSASMHSYCCAHSSLSCIATHRNFRPPNFLYRLLSDLSPVDGVSTSREALTPSRLSAFRLCHTNGFYRGRMFASAYKERTLCKSRFPQCPQYTQYLQYVVPIFRLFERRDLFLSSFSTPSIHPV